MEVASFKRALLINTPFLPPFLASPKCQLIVCQMSSTRCPTLNWLLLPLCLVVATVIAGAATSRLESALLYTLTAAFTLAHIHYGVQVVSDGEQRELPLGNTEGCRPRWGAAGGLRSAALDTWRVCQVTGGDAYSNCRWFLREFLF